MTTARRNTRPTSSPAVASLDPGARRRAYGPRWKWRAFPVLAAFVFGALIASLIDRPDSDFAVGVRIALVIVAAACLAHMFVAYILAPRRMSVRTSSAAGDEEPYEEELVFEDEP